MSLSTLLNPASLPIIPLLTSTEILWKDVMEYIMFDTLLHPNSRGFAPFFMKEIVRKAGYYHFPLHVVHIAGLVGCSWWANGSGTGTAVLRENRGLYGAALALEMAMFVLYAPGHLRQHAVFERATRTGNEEGKEASKGAVAELYRLERWRTWTTNVPMWICCVIPVLKGLWRR